MNRKYDAARYEESVKLLRAFFHRPGITTDMIVGFPGETEEEFAQSLSFLRRCGFTAMHIFPIPAGLGPRLPRIAGPSAQGEKAARARRAAAVAAELEGAWLASWVGRPCPSSLRRRREGFGGATPPIIPKCSPGDGAPQRGTAGEDHRRAGTALVGERVEERENHEGEQNTTARSFLKNTARTSRSTPGRQRAGGVGGPRGR
ncbi:MAG: hypothetical protein ACLSAF_08130 [Intestinimonas sp.]